MPPPSTWMLNCLVGTGDERYREGTDEVYEMASWELQVWMGRQGSSCREAAVKKQLSKKQVPRWYSLVRTVKW